MTGVDRYAYEVVRELDRLLEEGEAQIAVPARADIVSELPLENIEMVRIGRHQGHVWEQLDLNKHLKKNSLLGVNLCNTAPILNPGIVCIHDMNVRANPQFYSKGFAIVYRVMLSFLTKNAVAVLTDSRFSKDEIEKYYPAAKGKIVVIPCSWQHIERVESDMSILARNGLTSKSYYFAMSSLAPNKNLKWLVETARLNPDETIAIAGGMNARVFGEHGIPKAENVKYLGYVSDAEAKALMENCKGFLYPTFYEGFGIPPMEALACGAPMAVSNTEVMHEIYRGAAHYIDPYVPCGDLDGLFAGSVDRPELVLDGYGWAKSAGVFHRILEEVAIERRGASL